MVKPGRTCQALSKRAQVSPGKTSRLRRGRYSQRSTGAGEGTRCPSSFVGEAIGTCLLPSSTTTDRPTNGRTHGQLGAGGKRDFQNFLCPKMWMERTSSFSASSFGSQASPKYVTDSSFVELGVCQWRRTSTVAVSVAWAGLWRDVSRELDAWVGLKEHLSVKAHKPLRLCTLGSSLLMIGLAVCWLLQLASWWFLTHRAPPSCRGGKGTRPMRPSPAWLTGSRVFLLHDSVWTLMGLVAWSKASGVTQT